MVFNISNIVLLSITKMDMNSRERVIKELEKIGFCYIFANLKLSPLEPKFCEIAKELRDSDGDPEKFEAAIKKLRNISLEKKDILLSYIANFQCITSKDRTKALYMLRRMASSLDGNNYSSYTLEHIIPETRNDSWNHIPEEDYDKIVSKFGNLTLVQSSDNASLGGKSFNEKCGVYKTIPCRLTNSLACPLETGTNDTIYDKSIMKFDYRGSTDQEWDEDEIDRRTDSYIKLIEYIWFDPKYKF